MGELFRPNCYKDPIKEERGHNFFCSGLAHCKETSSLLKIFGNKSRVKFWLKDDSGVNDLETPKGKRIGRRTMLDFLLWLNQIMSSTKAIRRKLPKVWQGKNQGVRCRVSPHKHINEKRE